jgi:hypothetical protein
MKFDAVGPIRIQRLPTEQEQAAAQMARSCHDQELASQIEKRVPQPQVVVLESATASFTPKEGCDCDGGPVLYASVGVIDLDIELSEEQVENLKWLWLDPWHDSPWYGPWTLVQTAAFGQWMRTHRTAGLVDGPIIWKKRQ